MSNTTTVPNPKAPKGFGLHDEGLRAPSSACPAAHELRRKLRSPRRQRHRGHERRGFPVSFGSLNLGSLCVDACSDYEGLGIQGFLAQGLVQGFMFMTERAPELRKASSAH